MVPKQLALTRTLIKLLVCVALINCASAICPALEEHKEGHLATMFSEWTSAKTLATLAARNETLKDVYINPSLDNCTLPLFYALLQKGWKEKLGETIVVHNTSQFGVDPNLGLAEFKRELREMRMTIFDLTTMDEMSRIIFKGREPRWIDTCQKRPDRNETLLRVELGEPARHHSPATLEKDRRERGRYIKAVAKRRGHTMSPQAQYELDLLSQAETGGTTPSSWTPAAYTPKERRRRSIWPVEAGELASKSAYRPTVVGYEKKWRAALVYKRPTTSGQLAASSKSQWWPKKTTFSFSSPTQFMANNKFARHHFNGHAKNRFLVATGEELYRASLASTTPAPLGAEEKARHETKINQILLTLFHLDMRVSWFLNHGLSTLSLIRQRLGELLALIDSRGASQVSPARRQQIVSVNRKWLPTLDELVAASAGGEQQSASQAGLFNITGGLYDGRQRALILNVTQYVQFFGVALEQMKYDQVRLNDSGPANDTAYRHVDRLLNMLQCDMENVLRNEAEFTLKRVEFEQLYAIHHPQQAADLDDFYQHLVKHQLGRDHTFTGANIESPIARAFGKLAPDQQRQVIHKMATYSPEMAQRVKSAGGEIVWPRHIWREIMPLEARQLASGKERAARDSIILNDLSTVLDCYESLMLANYI